MPLSGTFLRYIAISLLCYETEPRVNMEKFRELTGLGSVASAREMLRQAKKKLQEEHNTLTDGGVPGELSLAATPKKAKAATPRSRKKTTPIKSALGFEDSDEETKPATPTKKRKAMPTPTQTPSKKQKTTSLGKVDEKIVKEEKEEEMEDVAVSPKTLTFGFGEDSDEFDLP